MWNFLVVVMNVLGGLLLGSALANWWMSLYEANLISESVEVIGFFFLIFTIAAQMYYVTDKLLGED